MCVTPTQDMIITCGKGGVLNLYNSGTLYKERTLTASPYTSIMDGHMSPIYCIKHHPVDTWNFLSGGWDNTVHFWDRREVNSIKHLSGVHVCGKTIDIDQSTNTILVSPYMILLIIETVQEGFICNLDYREWDIKGWDTEGLPIKYELFFSKLFFAVQ